MNRHPDSEYQAYLDRLTAYGHSSHGYDVWKAWQAERVNRGEQPSYEEKCAAIEGRTSAWMFSICAVPPVTHDRWSTDDWIVWIGADRWVKKPA